jgi:malonyl CoA-acyl carrier protein transacylase
MTSVEKYVPDIKKYTAAVDEEAVAGIVTHLGIALRNRDASFVASTDPEELKRVRESWLKKKLGLKESDAALDGAIHSVMEKMKAVRMKERVTVYYLLAEHFRKLASLKKADAAHEKKIA